MLFIRNNYLKPYNCVQKKKKNHKETTIKKLRKKNQNKINVISLISSHKLTLDGLTCRENYCK